MFERSLLATAAAAVALSSALSAALPGAPDAATRLPFTNRRIKSRTPHNGACVLGPFSSIKKHMRHHRQAMARQRASAG